MHWISGDAARAARASGAKTRYRMPDAACTLAVAGDGCRATFDAPQWAPTPGQYLVLYDGDVCLGGGVIDAVPAEPERCSRRTRARRRPRQVDAVTPRMRCAAARAPQRQAVAVVRTGCRRRSRRRSSWPRPRAWRHRRRHCRRCLHAASRRCRHRRRKTRRRHRRPAIAAAEQLHAVADHFGRIFLDAFLVGPLARLQAALDIDGAALFQVFAGDLGLAPEQHHRVPFRFLLLFAGLVLPGVGGGDAQVGHGVAARRVARLRIAAEVADQDHLVDRGHRAFLPSIEWSPPPPRG